MARRLALITGASAGIGSAFARTYAMHGYDVALTARRGDRLEKLAGEISLGSGVEVLTIAAFAKVIPDDWALALMAGQSGKFRKA